MLFLVYFFLFFCSYIASLFLFFFFFNDTATTEIYTLSLHDALPIRCRSSTARRWPPPRSSRRCCWPGRSEEHTSELQSRSDLVCRLLLEKKNLPGAAGCAGPATVGAAQPLERRVQPKDLVSEPAARGSPVVPSGHSTDADAFFFNDTATTEIYTLSLHDALPI